MATSVPQTSEKTQPPPYEGTQQQADYPSATQDVSATTVVAQPATVQMFVPLAFGPLPVNMTCPYCQAQVVTATTYEPGVLTWLFCGGIALVGCWCGCCFIPFCVDDVQDCRHSCPNCNNFLGVFRRI